MIGPSRQPNHCANLNHRRSEAMVRHCPQCGNLLNSRMATQSCTEARHAASRRQRSIFCIDCGAQLIFSR